MRAAAAAALLALACLLSACGSSGSERAPRGNPDARHGGTAVDNYAAVELLRALLIASSDGYNAGGGVADARTQLSRARANYAVLEGAVKARDPVVDREVSARFDLLTRDLRRSVSPKQYQGLAGPLFDQLMDGVAQALVPEKARDDRGVQAEALRRLAARMGADYDVAASSPGDDTSKLAFQEAWGIWRRAQIVGGLLKASLGPENSAVNDTIGNLRAYGFPNGPAPPANPPAGKVDAATAKIVNALLKRYALDS